MIHERQYLFLYLLALVFSSRLFLQQYPTLFYNVDVYPITFCDIDKDLCLQL